MVGTTCSPLYALNILGLPEVLNKAGVRRSLSGFSLAFAGHVVHDPSPCEPV